MTGVLLWAADISAVGFCMHLTSCVGLLEGTVLLLLLVVLVLLVVATVLQVLLLLLLLPRHHNRHDHYQFSEGTQFLGGIRLAVSVVDCTVNTRLYREQ